MEKKSRGKNVVIVVLVLVVLGLVGYIVYDKFIVEDVNEPIKVEKKSKTSLLNKEEALKIGKERYEYVRDGLYSCGYEKVKTDANKGINVVDNTMVPGNQFLKIANIDEIKSNLTEHAYLDWVKEPYIQKYENDYYINLECGERPDYARDEYQIEVKEIKENNIIYSISEYFYSVDGGGNVVEDINKAEKNVINFELVKEDNMWKIKEYTDVQEVQNNK